MENSNLNRDNTSLRIFLTTPPIEKIVEPIYDKPGFIRTSLAVLLGILRKDDRLKLGCIDAKFEQKNHATLLEEIFRFKPDILGISSFTYEIIAAGELADAVRKKFPDCLILIGGSHVTALPELTLKEFPNFDVAVVDEAEISMPELCTAILIKQDWRQIKGIAFRTTEGEIFCTPTREKIQDLDQFPMPAWDFFPAASEYFIQSSRGCPYNCNFCFNPNGHKVRRRSVKNIIDEIQWLIRHKNPARISFGDEAFAADRPWAMDLLNNMISHRIAESTSWDIQTHVSFIDDEIVRKMKQAGVSRIEMGVESGNEEILKKIGKGINKQMVLNAFKIVKKHKIRSGAFFILGHPGETRKTIWETIRFAGKVNPTEPIFALMVPFPGTRIYDYAHQELYGYFKPNNDWSLYRKQISNELTMKNLSNSQLRKYLIMGNLWTYMVNFRILGLIRFLYSNRRSAWFFFRRK